MATALEIKTRLGTWMVNTEAKFVTAKEEIIENAEQMISREFDTDAMIEHESTTLVQGQEFLGKPTSWVNTLSFFYTVSSNQVPLEYRSYSFMQDYHPNRATEGAPLFWCNWDEVKFLILPTPDSAYPVELEYMQRINGLFDLADSGTTWLSLNHPDLLFYACLIQAGIFEKNTKWIQTFTPVYDRLLARALEETGRSRRDQDNLKE